MKVRLTVIAAVATLLSSIGLHPLFMGSDWAWAGAGATLTVAGAGLLGRRLRLSAVLCLLLSCASLFLFVTLVYASHQAWLAVIPSPSSVAKLGSLIGAGWNTADHYAAPVPLNHGVSLMAALGIGIVALIVDFLAVRLRRAAPAGLPLLAMYSVPAAVHEESIGWLAFILGSAGFMALLLADAQEQVSGWGRHVYSARWVDDPESPQDRPVRTVTDERPDSSALAASGRRIGLAALTLAVALPVVIPGIHPKGLFGLGGNGTGNGPGDGSTSRILTPNGLVSMHRQLLQPGSGTVLTYKTDDPGAQPDYLRIYALDSFDGEVWKQVPISTTPRDKVTDKPLPIPPGFSTATPVATVTTRVSIGKHTKGVIFLPMPYAPTRVQISGDWRVDSKTLMVFAPRDTANPKDYSVTSLRVLPTAQQLQASTNDLSQPWLQDETAVSNVPKSIRDEARRIVRLAHATTPYQQALAVERYFSTTGGFTYSLNAPEPTTVSDLEDFLFHQKTGYCEQFASSMALMARELGIPARVAVGYTQGTKEGDRWVVRTRDAHAWPELYFEGTGWIRFEPTPTGVEGIGGQGSATVPAYAETPDPSRSGNIGGPGAITGPQPGASPTTNVRGHHLNEPDGPAGVVATPKAKSSVPWGWITVGVLVVLLLAIPMAVRLITRRRRWSVPAEVEVAPEGPSVPRPSGRTARVGAGADAAETAHAAWAELRADAIDHGLPWHSTETPRATARRLAQLLELSSAATSALERISAAEERARYATTPAPAQTLRADVRTMREAFGAAVSRSARLRARLAPPTAMESLRSAGTQAVTALDQQAIRLRALFRFRR